MHRNEENQDKTQPVHDREPYPRGRGTGGAKSGRPGYPVLILGSGAVTNVLTEIAALHTVAVKGLPERQIVTDANLGYLVRGFSPSGLFDGAYSRRIATAPVVPRPSAATLRASVHGRPNHGGCQWDRVEALPSAV